MSLAEQTVERMIEAGENYSFAIGWVIIIAGSIIGAVLFGYGIYLLLKERDRRKNLIKE